MRAYAPLRRREKAEDDDTGMPKCPTGRIAAENHSNADASSFGEDRKRGTRPHGGVTQLTQARRSRGAG